MERSVRVVDLKGVQRVVDGIRWNTTVGDLIDK